MTNKFELGDKVVIVNDHWIWTDGKVPEDTVYTLISDQGPNVAMCNTTNLTIEIEATQSYPRDFQKVAIQGPINTTPAGEPVPVALGVFRPNLEDRKVGKVRVELVDDGFPLALREIAKVMTWAQTAKGYKDHDWQNLPNPEQGLSGATSRHRSDNIIQRMVDGLDAKDCVDGESGILHKAHEAFGVLAQLELILRGKIQ